MSILGGDIQLIVGVVGLVAFVLGMVWLHAYDRGMWRGHRNAHADHRRNAAVRDEAVAKALKERDAAVIELAAANAAARSRAFEDGIGYAVKLLLDLPDNTCGKDCAAYVQRMRTAGFSDAPTSLLSVPRTPEQNALTAKHKPSKPGDAPMAPELPS